MAHEKYIASDENNSLLWGAAVYYDDDDDGDMFCECKDMESAQKIMNALNNVDLVAELVAELENALNIIVWTASGAGHYKETVESEGFRKAIAVVTKAKGLSKS